MCFHCCIARKCGGPWRLGHQAVPWDSGGEGWLYETAGGDPWSLQYVSVVWWSFVNAACSEYLEWQTHLRYLRAGHCKVFFGFYLSSNLHFCVEVFLVNFNGSMCMSNVDELWWFMSACQAYTVNLPKTTQLHTKTRLQKLRQFQVLGLLLHLQSDLPWEHQNCQFLTWKA